MGKVTRDDFVHRANLLHNHKYKYDNVCYVNYLTKVDIECPVHGYFSQSPKNHLSGRGCPLCSGRKRHTLDSFAEKANKIHNFKYDYSLVNYKNNKTSVKIICPIHGVFEQVPNTHLDGCGCPKCATQRSALNTSEFIRRSREIFGDYYDYSLVDYRNNHTKVKIICPVHGVFYQKPHGHLQGWGCVKCGNINQQYTTDEFIELAKKVHGSKYDYTLTNYTGSSNKIKIQCKKHGLFIQRASAHLLGAGCPRCRQSSGEQYIKKYLDATGVLYKQQYKLSDCKFKNCLPFDFAIFNSDNTLRCLLEYQGIQHYKNIKWFGKGYTDFVSQQKRDLVKKDYCLKHGIPLLEVSYLQNLDEFFAEAGGLLWK